ATGRRGGLDPRAVGQVAARPDGRVEGRSRVRRWRAAGRGGPHPVQSVAVRIATRGSELARWQATFVADRLAATVPDLTVELVVVDTAGDRRPDVPVWEMGGQGVFVKEVQAAVLDGRADIAVHSAKDLPSVTAPGLRLASVPTREDPRDALVGSTLAA